VPLAVCPRHGQQLRTIRRGIDLNVRVSSHYEEAPRPKAANIMRITMPSGCLGFTDYQLIRMGRLGNGREVQEGIW